MVQHVPLDACSFERVESFSRICNGEVLQSHGDLRESPEQRNLSLSEIDVSIDELVSIFVYESGKDG